MTSKFPLLVLTTGRFKAVVSDVVCSLCDLVTVRCGFFFSFFFCSLSYLLLSGPFLAL